MPAFNHYCYQMPWGFMTCNVDEDTPPTEYIERWGVNEEEAQQIADGAELEVVDGELVITPVALEGEVL